MTPVGIEPRSSRFGVRRSTTTPPRPIKCEIAKVILKGTDRPELRDKRHFILESSANCHFTYGIVNISRSKRYQQLCSAISFLFSSSGKPVS